MSKIDITKYPFLIPAEWDTVQDTLMFFWIECWDWWDTLLTALFDELLEIVERDKVKLYFIQVKEKYWWLRLYYEWWNQNIDNLISSVEQLSYHICEHCWSNGKLRDDIGRRATLCDSCNTLHSNNKHD